MEMENCQRHWLWYDYDEKYTTSHKFKEHKLFHRDVTSSTPFDEPIVTDDPQLEVADQAPPM